MAQTEMTENPAMPEATDMNPVSDTTPAAPAEDPADDSALRKRLLSRMAVAGVVILGLLGGLAVFDVVNKPQTPALPKMAAAPIEPPAVTEPEKPAEAVKEEPKEEVAAEPERTETVMEPPKAAKPLTLPATPRTASIKPPPPNVVPAKPDVRQEVAKVIPERSAPVATQAVPAAAKPLAQVVEGAKRFLVQVGVFSNHANAEELVTKLQAAGIPAQIESRVQVGPFASRAEADAARAKLKSMGIDDGLLVRR
ncbi:MAG: SPOR domain-containing protein [Pseudomonadota bacterium]